MTDAAIIIAFRDRGIDPCRQANLIHVVEYWEDGDWPIHVVSDGRDGTKQFNRSRAYNRGAAATDADVLCYIEADTMVPYEQMSGAIELARQPGMVVPFSHQLKLGESDSAAVRGGASSDDFEPVVINETYKTTINHGSAVVVSCASLDAVGQWDESFEGHGHDDTAMAIAFHHACGPMRFVKGVAIHLYHQEMDPGLTPDRTYISDADMAAQDRNRERLALYRKARTPQAIRELTAGRTPQVDWRARRAQ